MSASSAPLLLNPLSHDEQRRAKEEHPPCCPAGESAIEGEAAASATVASSTFNLANTILGSGVCAMPYACRESGIAPFLLLLGTFGYAANLALQLLVIAAENATRRGQLRELQYAALAKCTAGRRAELAAEWAVIVQQLGCAVAYIVIIADVLAPIAALGAADAGSPLCSRAMWQAAVALGIILPLCLLRRLDALRFTSLLALCAFVAFVGAVVVNGVRASLDPALRDAWTAGAGVNSTCSSGSSGGSGGSGSSGSSSSSSSSSSASGGGGAPPGSRVRWLPDSAGPLISSLPIVCFAFLCHMNVFPIYAELKERRSPSSESSSGGSGGGGGGAGLSLKRRDMFRVGTLSIAICAAVYGLSGAFGYLIFLDATSSNLFVNFFTNGRTLFTIIDVLRIGVTFSVVFAFPIIVWEARHGLEQQIFGHQPFDFWRNFGLNAGILAFALILGCIIPASGLNIPLGLIGSTASPLIVFILPALCHRELVKMEKEGSEKIFGPNAISRVNNFAGKTYETLADVALWSGVILIPVCLGVWAWQLATN
jgi:amino acid permease